MRDSETYQAEQAELMICPACGRTTDYLVNGQPEPCSAECALSMGYEVDDGRH